MARVRRGTVRQSNVSGTVGPRRLVDHLLTVVIALLWAYGWVPSLITVISQGRAITSSTSDGPDVEISLATSVSGIILHTAEIVLLVMLLLALVNLITFKPAALVGVLLPWISIYVVDLYLGGGRLQTFQLAFPLLTLAICLARPSTSAIYLTLARLTVITSVFSILLGSLTRYGLMPSDWHSGDDKALIGNSILAGPYSHSNALALTLALGLPFVVFTFSGARRNIYMVIVAFALLWSSSRTSLLVSVAILVICIVVAVLKSATSRKLMKVTLAVGIALMVVVPLVTKDPTAFTNRGLIWQRSLAAVRDALILGHGPSVYTTINSLTLSIGNVTTTGHNIFVTILTTGGAVGLVLFIVAMVVLGRHAFAVYARDTRPLLFLANIVLLGIVEDPLRALRVGPQVFIVWVVIAAICSDQLGQKLRGGRLRGGRLQGEGQAGQMSRSFGRSFIPSPVKTQRAAAASESSIRAARGRVTRSATSTSSRRDATERSAQ